MKILLVLCIAFLCSSCYPSSLGEEVKISNQESAVHVRETRPSRCSHLLDPGNEDLDSPWKVCMGVGPK